MAAEEDGGRAIGRTRDKGEREEETGSFVEMVQDSGGGNDRLDDLEDELNGEARWQSSHCNAWKVPVFC